MIILDTNVLSALMQQTPDTQVITWLDQQNVHAIWISSITLFEIRYGLALLAPGKRKDILRQRFELLLQNDLENRVLLFDTHAATHAATLSAERRKRGHAVDMRDTFIAGIALAKQATLATRNTRHFDDLTIPLVNPWEQTII